MQTVLTETVATRNCTITRGCRTITELHFCSQLRSCFHTHTAGSYISNRTTTWTSVLLLHWHMSDCAVELEQQVKSAENLIIKKWLLFCWFSLLNQDSKEEIRCQHEGTVGSALQAAPCCKTRHLNRDGHSSVLAQLCISMPCFSISSNNHAER